MSRFPDSSSHSNQPQVRLSQHSLELTATKFGEKITRTIMVSNPSIETKLEGEWEVAPHPNDPPHRSDSHAWITIQPANFLGNQVKCKITVDTSNLWPKRVYERQLLLHTNSAIGTYIFTIHVKTAPLTKSIIWLYAILASHFMLSAISGVLLGTKEVIEAGAIAVAGLMLWVVAVFGVVLITSAIAIAKGIDLLYAFCVAGLVAGATSLAIAIPVLVGIGISASEAISIACTGFSLAMFLSLVVDDISAIGINKRLTILILLLTVGFGISLGVCFILPLLLRSELIGKYNIPNSLRVMALVGTGLPLATILRYAHIYRQRFIAKYHRSEPNKIKP